MLEVLTPHRRLDSILGIDPPMLQTLGIQGLLLDLDCTLVDYGATVFPAATLTWVERMRGARLKLCILSNGGERRVLPMATQLGVPCVTWAAKPLTFGLRTALAKLELPAGQVAVVGDQLFTDVMVGRLAGAYTILVRPTTRSEAWVTRIKRPLERMVLRRLGEP